MEGWSLFFNVLTGLSTFAMAIAAFMALNAWKNQQKRSKLVNLLEELNKCIQNWQYYEIETTVFTRRAREARQEYFQDSKLLEEQRYLIDMELAEDYADCILLLKNWLIEDETKTNILDDINKQLQSYRIKIYDYEMLKIKLFIDSNYFNNIRNNNLESNLQVYECLTKIKPKLVEKREKLQNLIDSLKKDYRKLLK